MCNCASNTLALLFVNQSQEYCLYFMPVIPVQKSVAICVPSVHHLQILSGICPVLLPYCIIANLVFSCQCSCSCDWSKVKDNNLAIVGLKIKVVVNFIYGYQNRSGEKYKSNGKRISSIRHTSKEKNPKNHPKIPNFRKVFQIKSLILDHNIGIWG